MSKHTVQDVLRMAGYLLEDPKRWARGTFARDSVGLHVDLTDTRATCFCVAGAVRVSARALKVPQQDAVSGLRKLLRKEQVTIIWDRGTDTHRTAIAAKLRAA
jgi:hypothetical protein